MGRHGLDLLRPALGALHRACAEAARAGRPFDQKAFDREIRDFECRWADASHSLALPETGDALATARELAVKYRPLIEALP